DRRSVRVDQVRPLRIEHPQRAAAAGAEVAAPGTDAAAAIVLADLRLVDAQVLASVHFQGAGARAQVDGAAAASGGLAANRAIAMQERRRRVRLAAETHLAAMAGTFELHDTPP